MVQNDGKAGKEMEFLIGGPLKAAADASAALSKSTAEFIEKIGFDDKGKVRTATFKYRGGQSPENSKGAEKEVSLDVPLLAIVPIPNLQIDEVNVLFDMEVKESCQSRGEVEAANHKIPKGLDGLFSFIAEASDPAPMAEVERSPKAKEEKIRRIRQELQRLEEEHVAAKSSLELHIEKLKKASEEQRKAFQERLHHLIEETRADSEKETYIGLLEKVNVGLDEFKNNVSALVKILSIFALAKNDVVSEIFELDPNGSNLLFDMGDYQTADFYGKMVVAIREQQSLNSIGYAQQEKTDEYNQLLLAEKEEK